MCDSTVLCRRMGVTVLKYKQLRDAGNKKQLARFLRELFDERYLGPLRAIPSDQSSGFAIMALCCLTIEGLEAFRQGWPRTDDKSEEAFTRFFQREERFDCFAGFEHWFYVNVRCGILHVGQTQHGWKIHNNDYEPLFNHDPRVVNAKIFLSELEKSVEQYASLLEKAPWEDDTGLWGGFRKRMESVIHHCKV